MTPTATYIASENCLQELPRIPKPNLWHEPGIMNPTHIEDQDEYSDHLASLRRIPCSPECKELWTDQQVLTEDKDYGINQCCAGPEHCNELCKEVGAHIWAFPLVPVKSEDEFVWTDELVKEYAEQYRFSSSRISIEQFKYSLTKR